MTIPKARFVFALIVLASCSNEPVDDPIPIASFNDIVINLSLPEYLSLQQVQGNKLLNNGGIRGIILYRKATNTFVAYERNCSFQPNSACATVDVHSSGLFLIDPCCTSTFDFADGNPTGGPAWRPLRMYRTQFQNNVLTITDEVIN